MKPLFFFVLLSLNVQAQTFDFKVDSLNTSRPDGKVRIFIGDSSYYVSNDYLLFKAKPKPDTIRALLLVSDTVASKLRSKFPNTIFKETFCLHGYIVHGIGNLFTPPLYLDDRRQRLGKNLFVWMAVPK